MMRLLHACLTLFPVSRICLACAIVLQCLLVHAKDDVRSDSATIGDFRQMGIPIYSNNSVIVLPSCQLKYSDLFGKIQNAERYVHLDYFKFQQDSICRQLFDLLARKAEQGVEVRVIYDYFGNSHSDLPLKDSFLDVYRARGVKVYAYDKVKFPWVNHLFHRNHHKIAIIDGEFLYTGGMNVADYYIHGKPGIGAWRDTHMRVTGDAVEGYQKIFLDLWEKVSGERPDASKYEIRHHANDSILMAVCNRVPRKSPEIIRETYCTAIDNARYLIQIVNPYPCLFGDVKRALQRALKRGVKVEFLVSRRSDVMANADVTGIEMHRLMKRGADIYYYEGAFHHSKLMMVDGLFCTIGTANLDARSLRFDLEVNSYIFDKGVTSELQDIFESDKSVSMLLTPENWKELFPLKRKVRARIFMSVKKLL